MLKYLCFIILGIVLFLLWNHINRFSIGNQYSLEPDPITILLDMFYKICRNENICVDMGFDECYRQMSAGGGSCQLNTVLGLYNVLGIPFRPEDRKFINSFGNKLKLHMNDIYDYLTNRPSMRPLLVQNNLNPRMMVYNKPFNDLSKNKLYPTYIGFSSRVPERSFEFIHSNGMTLSLNYGHNLLMYKTDFNGLQSFRDNIPPIDTCDEELRMAILNGLDDSLRLLNSADSNNNIRTNGSVCIMIDLCQKKFYAVTELDYPSTVAFFDDVHDDVHAVINEYNTLWKIKINIKYFVHYGAITLQPSRNSMYVDDLNPLNIVDITDNESVLPQQRRLLDSWKDHEGFRAQNHFKVYIPETLAHLYAQDFQVDTLELKPSESYYGKIDRLCRDEGQYSICDDDMLCMDKERSGDIMGVCIKIGTLGMPCKDDDGQNPRCDDGLSCERDEVGGVEEICEKRGGPYERCRSRGSREPQCDHNLQCRLSIRPWLQEYPTCRVRQKFGGMFSCAVGLLGPPPNMPDDTSSDED